MGVFPLSKSYLKFHVYRAESGDVHGQYSGCVWRNGQPAEWLTCDFGKLAAATFPEALALAKIHGIAEIQINNPELFATLGFGPSRQQGVDHAHA